MSWHPQVFEFLAAPAHIWLWFCAKICGGTFECGPVDADSPVDEDGNIGPR